MKTPDSFAVSTLHTLLSAMDEAVSIVNKSGVMVYWNEAAERFFDIKKEDILGKNVRNFFREEDVMNLKVLKTEKPVREVYHQPRPNLHVVISTIPIYDVRNQLVGSMSIEKDISYTVNLNEKLLSTTEELQQLKQKIDMNNLDDPFKKIKGKSLAIQRALLDAQKAAKTDATVLITGESGVGKELFAHAIHEVSLRRQKPFISVNCGAIPQALFESELFGYEAGAFTGASKNGKAGKIELADEGTLFLDEVGELPLEMQVKLLRAVQDLEIYRIGGRTPKKFNVRIIAATNRSLEKMLSEGTFRSDLFYRLNVIAINIPPLRERMDDISELVLDFLKEFSFKYSKTLPDINDKTIDLLRNYDWPGNIRELRNIMERLIVLKENMNISQTDIADLLPETKTFIDYNTNTHTHTHIHTLTAEKESLEKERILQTLQITHGNKSLTAKELGMTRATLYKKIKKYGIVYGKEPTK